MPTLNPRVNVTLSPSLDSLVSRLAGLERVSKSTVLRELLETAEPMLLQAVALMEAAEGASVKARKTIARDMQESIRVLEGASHLMQSVAANHTRDIVSEAEAVRGRRPPRAPKGAGGPRAEVRRTAELGKVVKLAKRPPSSNRGVKP